MTYKRVMSAWLSFGRARMITGAGALARTTKRPIKNELKIKNYFVRMVPQLNEIQGGTNKNYKGFLFKESIDGTKGCVSFKKK